VKIFELDNSAINNEQLIALATFLKKRASEMGAKPELSLASFQLMAQHMNIPMSFDILQQMITQPPLNNVISKIDGDKIYFKTDDSIGAMSTGKNMPDGKTTVDNMAKSAMKSHKK